MEITYVGGKEEGSPSSLVIEEPIITTHIGSYVESTTPCGSPQ